MEATYKAYRNMKRSIRNDAAKDIQRYFRGHVTRKRCKQERNSSPGFIPMEMIVPSEIEESNESDDERLIRTYRDADVRSTESEIYSDEDALMEKSMGSLANELNGVGIQSSESEALKGRMKSLFSMKRDMKDKLHE